MREQNKKPAGAPLVGPDLEERHSVRGKRRGDRYVRIVRPAQGEFERRDAHHLVATEQVLAPTTAPGRVVDGIRRILFGARIPTSVELGERIGKVKGLAVFASDNISSSAYATEEIMRVLLLAGLGTMAALTLPITLAVIVVLAVVVVSYQQTIGAYPNGGGSYIVANDNLGPFPGLTAAAALLTDYVLTVAVSIAAGVAALTSIFPQLFDIRVAVGVAFVTILAIGNLRGIRESATIFALPTYVYLFAIFGLLAYGLFRFATGTLPEYTAPPEWSLRETIGPLGILLVLRAFASGSVALTGVEAVSNGVPAFKRPESRNAKVVLILMGSFFGAIFLGMSFLAGQLGIIPDPTEQETVVSQLTRTFVGNGSPYHYLVQISTALLLVLAANTAFADFPRLSSILARDRFVPHYFQFRGDRLAFTTGIVVLALLSAVLILAFAGSVTALIPLYTVGVFVAFTLSQAGMVRHWWRLRIPALIALMWAINRHYRSVEDALTVDKPHPALPRRASPRVLVLLARLDRASLESLAYARSIAPLVTAVHVTDDPAEGERIRARWQSLELDGDTELVILESPYRALIPPLVAYIDALQKQEPERSITVVLSEFVPRHPWEYLLHNHAALRLKLRLFFRPNTVVIDVPYHV
jgi:amino acid transporter